LSAEREPNSGAGGELPVVISFVDMDEHVNRVPPKLREIAAHRLIVRENAVIEQGSLDWGLRHCRPL
jgi:hypothetical protein